VLNSTEAKMAVKTPCFSSKIAVKVPDSAPEATAFRDQYYPKNARHISANHFYTIDVISLTRIR